MKTLPFLNGTLSIAEYSSRLKASQYIDELVWLQVIDPPGEEQKLQAQATMQSKEGKSPSKLKD